MVLFLRCGLSHIQNITLNHQIVRGLDLYPPWVGSNTKWMLAQKLHLYCGIRKHFSAVSGMRWSPATRSSPAHSAFSREKTPVPGLERSCDTEKISRPVLSVSCTKVALPSLIPVQSNAKIRAAWCMGGAWVGFTRSSWSSTREKTYFSCKYQPGFPSLADPLSGGEQRYHKQALFSGVTKKYCVLKSNYLFVRQEWECSVRTCYEIKAWSVMQQLQPEGFLAPLCYVTEYQQETQVSPIHATAISL